MSSRILPSNPQGHSVHGQFLPGGADLFATGRAKQRARSTSVACVFAPEFRGTKWRAWRRILEVEKKRRTPGVRCFVPECSGTPHTK